MKECTNDQNKQKNKTRKYKENKKYNNNTTIVPEGVIPKYLQTTPCIYKQYTGIYINMNQHCWLQNINIFSYLSDKSLIERQLAIKFARFLQISLSSLLNNHINLFLSDNSEKKMLFILEKKVFLAKEYLLHLINTCSSSSKCSNGVNQYFIEIIT